jgi:AAA+ ATPase superfamily predicted ATPase
VEASYKRSSRSERGSIIASFVEFLQKVDLELGVKDVLEAEDIFDILWLALQIDSSKEAITRSPRADEEKRPQNTPHLPPEQDIKKSVETPRSSPAPTIQQSSSPHDPIGTGLYFPSERGMFLTRGGLLFESPAVSALPESLDLVHALRPLMRRIPSRTHRNIDENMTAQRTAEWLLAQRTSWFPVLKPIQTRWFDLALVIDESRSMDIWRQRIVALKHLLEQLGAFRDVRTWGLVMNSERNTPHVRTWLRAKSRMHNPEELKEPGGQRLILVVSDCVARMWHDGCMSKVLESWGHVGPVTIIQVLPPRLWSKSALSYHTAVQLWASLPGLPNTQLDYEATNPFIRKADLKGRLPMPVVTLEKEASSEKWVAEWVKAVLTAENEQTYGYLLIPTAEQKKTYDATIQNQNVALPLTTEQLVRHFSVTASPKARALAGLLAAAPIINFPMVRLIQKTMLPSNLSHVAEVFLSGLIKQLSGDSANPDVISYDFVEGVRDLILDAQPQSKSAEVLHIAIAHFVEQQIGQSPTVSVLLEDPRPTAELLIGKASQPFANITSKVLQRLGGDYAMLATYLEKMTRKDQEELTEPPDSDQVIGHESFNKDAQFEHSQNQSITSTSAANNHIRSQSVSVIEAVTIELGSAIAKSILKAWLKDSSLEDDISSSLIDLLKKRTSDVLAQRSGRRQFELIGEKVGKDLLPIFEQDGAQLDEGSRTAIALSAANAINLLSSKLLAESSLGPAQLEKHILDTYPLVNQHFNSTESELYKRIIQISCPYIIDIASQLPSFNDRTFAEVLKRETLLIEQAELILQEVRHIRESLGSTKAGRFEEEYCKSVARKLDELQLFGTDVSSANRRHRLSVAYITLSVEQALPVLPKDRQGSVSKTAKTFQDLQYEISRDRVSVDTALARPYHLVISGTAGSGKTTLLQWLAVKAALKSFDGALAHWNNTVPFYIRLRSCVPSSMPKPEQFPELVTPTIAGSMPSGWVHTQLRSGRAIVLVDGLDEVFPSQREEVRIWLKGLIETFPQVRYIITSRPHAIEDDWMALEDFSEAELQPMDISDIYSFIDHWHQAVREELREEEEKAELQSLAEHLKADVKRNRSLRNLATNPLLCAMLCALHRDRRQQLPADRIELYEACCYLLLERRDRERRVDLTDYPALNYRQKRLLLEDLAYWMIKNEWSEIALERVDERFNRKLTNMPGILSDISGSSIRRFFVERANIIRESVAGQIDFTHRVIQEFLAAKAISDEMDIGLLIANAHKDHWREVIILACGLGTAQMRQDLLMGLIDRGDTEKEYRYQLHFLAVSCLETSIMLDQKVKTEVEKRLSVLIPPRDMEDAKKLAAAGEMAVKYLARREYSASTSAACIRALALIGGDAALEVLVGYADDTRSIVVSELVRAWDFFDRQIYAEYILSLTFQNTTSLRLERLPSLIGIPIFTSLTSLTLSNCLHVSDLSPLANLSQLTSLTLSNCPQVSDLSPLANLSQLTSLTLSNCPQVSDLSPLANLSQLASLDLSSCEQVSDLTSLAGLSNLKMLDLSFCLGVRDLSIIATLNSLELLELRGIANQVVLPDNYKQTLDIRLSNGSFENQNAQFESIANPYAINASGSVVVDPEMFFGRADLINEITKGLSEPRVNINPIIMYGQKRVGKSSILYHLERRLKQENDLLVLNLGSIGAFLDDRSSVPLLTQILYHILSQLQNGIEENKMASALDLTFPVSTEFYAHPAPVHYFQETLRHIKRGAAKSPSLQNVQIVLLIDEFSYLYAYIMDGRLSGDFMKAWKGLLQENLFRVILTGQDVMIKFIQRFPNEFGASNIMRINYLARKDAEELIDVPIRIGGKHGESRYREKAVQLIFNMTAGNPYYIQIICSRLVEYMNHNRAKLITEAEVKQVKNELISGTNSLNLMMFENLISSGDASSEAISGEDLLNVISIIAANSKTEPCSKNKILCKTQTPIDIILDDLVSREVLMYESGGGYTIRVGLFKEWLNAHQ